MSTPFVRYIYSMKHIDAICAVYLFHEICRSHWYSLLIPRNMSKPLVHFIYSTIYVDAICAVYLLHETSRCHWYGLFIPRNMAKPLVHFIYSTNYVDAICAVYLFHETCRSRWCSSLCYMKESISRAASRYVNLKAEDMFLCVTGSIPFFRNVSKICQLIRRHD
jgi:hypothetical protein